jgi:pilus assembly protein Flp/PilA
MDPMISRAMSRMRMHYRSDDDGDAGQGLAEYGLLIALIAVVCIAALGTLGGAISGVLSGISGNL